MRGITQLLFMLLTLGLDGDVVPLRCKGDCPEGYLSVCVKRGDDCNCRCAKDVNAGATELEDLLRELTVSSEGIARGVKRYCELAGTGEFSFKLNDYGRIYTISGTNVWGACTSGP